MGTDADAHSGILVHSSNVLAMLSSAIRDVDVPVLRERLLADQAVRERLTEINAYLNVSAPSSDGGKPFIHAGDACAMLRKLSSSNAFVHWIEALFASAVEGETGKYSECWVKDEELIKTIVNVVVDVCALSFPSFELEAFGNSRLTGLWDIEHGDLYFNFDVDQCFKRVLTPVGQQLAARLGRELEVSDWVTVSY